MPAFVVTQIYFGKFEDLDPIEASGTGANIINDTNEKTTVPGWQQGVAFTKANLRLISITQNDTVHENKPGRLEENDFENRTASQGGSLKADTITYDLGKGPVTSEIDSTFTWTVDVTLADKTVVQRQVGFIQLVDGSILSNFRDADFNTLKVQTITLKAPVSSTFYGTTAGRSIAGAMIVCFAAGTAILTPNGERLVETLQVGDQVVTQDSGVQTLRWVHANQLDDEQSVLPRFFPVRIAAGALGAGLPLRDLYVSPQHRMLIRSPIVRRMFDCDEVLVGAKHLVPLPGIEITPVTMVSYRHFALDGHEIVFAEGAPAETFYLGRMAVAALAPVARHQLQQALPQYQTTEMTAARRLLNGKEARQLIARQLKNNRALLSRQ